MTIAEYTSEIYQKRPIKVFTLHHSSGAYFSVSEYAAAVTELFVPDRNGALSDVVLGFSTPDEYMASGACHGSVVGRVANRTKNASFSLDGKKFRMPKNDGENNLHGGPGSFQNVVWDSRALSREEACDYLRNTSIESFPDIDGEAVVFSHFSCDLTCGLPGNLQTEVLYAWTKDRTLLILFSGKSDQDTLFCPTNHTYFNLSGHDFGSVGNHRMMVFAKSVSEKETDGVPNGTLTPVDGTVFDFLNYRPLSQTMNDSVPQLSASLGLDQNFCLEKEEGKISTAAYLFDPYSGREMEVITTFPGLQVYTGNHTANTKGKGGCVYQQYAGVCLEAQFYPDAIHHPCFPSAVLPRGETKYYLTGYRFSCSS